MRAYVTIFVLFHLFTTQFLGHIVVKIVRKAIKMGVAQE